MRCEICDKMSMGESPCKECQEIIYIASHTMDYDIVDIHPDENGPPWVMWNDEEFDE
jgi:hypothetical protein